MYLPVAEGTFLIPVFPSSPTVRPVGSTKYRTGPVLSTDTTCASHCYTMFRLLQWPPNRISRPPLLPLPLQADLYTATSTIFLKQKSGHGAPFLQTFQMHLISVRIKSTFPVALHNLWPSLCPSPTVLQPRWCFCFSSMLSSFRAMPPGTLLHLIFPRTVSWDHSGLNSSFTSSDRPALASLAKAAYQSFTTL